MLDSSACSRVSLLVVALGLVCTCCSSFLIARPAGPHNGFGQRSGRGGSRLSTGGAGRATRMMAGDLDVSLRLVCFSLPEKELVRWGILPAPPPRLSRAFFFFCCVHNLPT